eukprot:TRINITY_DN5371_c0_g1_i3.p1 TRINITY_DN5371_c0_g1~~TRINITY_DN5371_c0_g1_i3.p1  ORF type:complete len:567 (-),score=131.00 TRINITY_DN5371_c0_g1_i3:44-1744(-)
MIKRIRCFGQVSYIVETKLNPCTKPQSQLLEDYLRESIGILIDANTSSANNSKQSLELHIQLANLCSEALGRDRSFFQSTFMAFGVDLLRMECDIFHATAENILNNFISPLRLKLDEISSEELSDVITLYLELKDLSQQLMIGEPSGRAYWLRLCKLFKPFIKKWLWECSQKLVMWATNSVQLETWKPVTDNVTESASVVDLFSACEPAITFFKALEWGVTEEKEEANDSFDDLAASLSMTICSAMSCYVAKVSEFAKKVMQDPNLLQAKQEGVALLEKVCVALSDLDIVCVHLSDMSTSLEALLTERNLDNTIVADMFHKAMKQARESCDAGLSLLLDQMKTRITQGTADLLQFSASKHSSAPGSVKKLLQKANTKLRRIPKKSLRLLRKRLHTPKHGVHAATEAIASAVISSDDDTFDFYNRVLEVTFSHLNENTFLRFLKLVWRFQVEALEAIILPLLLTPEEHDHAVEFINVLLSFFEADGEGLKRTDEAVADGMTKAHAAISAAAKSTNELHESLVRKKQAHAGDPTAVSESINITMGLRALKMRADCGDKDASAILASWQ